ncbi:MerR family transcriptional regulator [Krasilnikoviella flava]|uniref:DNA-binding transcriptional regulator, MerR family n=1 Tax=Krasilnikoviella flava TaxID=526729 RepID=A0A1T5IPE7_9MICO|nr:MerR family transcriptional regulator [Krasilnikoviella flava]SKC40813.1 DNA-binding transcriptional regulator, MerR family [Krasilnikoviella flava]
MDRPLRTVDVARATDYSVQQVRDLERLGVVPPAVRAPNGYRTYDARHVRAVRAYRGLAAAVGPAVARRTMTALQGAAVADAAAAVTQLHAGLAAERAQTLQALDALDAIRAEPTAPSAGGMLTITELADALGVRTSTLRHWESEGLLAPERVGSLRARVYDRRTVATARVVAVLRSAGYGIPALHRVVATWRGLGRSPDAEHALQSRLDQIATRSVALLRAGADLAAVLDDVGEPEAEPA